MEKINPSLDFPQDFRCPISMELMRDPVNNPTGVTYEQEHRKRLIVGWARLISIPARNSRPSMMAAVLGTIDSSPFKVSSLRKLRGSAPGNDEMKQILQLLMKPDCMRSMGIMLQRGSLEARFCTISTFQKMAKADYHWNYVAQDQGIDFFKSLLEIVSDEICTKASSSALKLLIVILEASKKSRLKAIEAGGVCTLVELLPDSNRSKTEKILKLIKLLCECAEERLLPSMGRGFLLWAKKMLNVSLGHQDRR
ncbi:E3 ubiquitin-protein ligase PUB23 [Sesamum angolense]|uniref:U-box domain-containing protein n=1 Tax=Sesamum angolense TaxID=2727404 RepID=A0AAE1XGG6_9LAMI|nr:E3 ubiquitin-protein ligase PUB23 [Sesamum angolense]